MKKMVCLLKNKYIRIHLAIFTIVVMIPAGAWGFYLWNNIVETIIMIYGTLVYIIYSWSAFIISLYIFEKREMNREIVEERKVA